MQTKEEKRQGVRDWRRGHRKEDRAAAARWAKNHPEQNAETQRRGRYRRKYGITVERYEALLAEQNGLCAICNSPAKNGRRLSVDHDHETNEVRGLLCVSCNTGVGYFERPISLAIQAYLKDHDGV